MTNKIHETELAINTTLADSSSYLAELPPESVVHIYYESLHLGKPGITRQVHINIHIVDIQQ